MRLTVRISHRRHAAWRICRSDREVLVFDVSRRIAPVHRHGVTLGEAVV